ncbi:MULTISPECIES: DUF2285 domain-containing protein [Alphaproteobacteria]|jgi:hypothetical protein|uniref:DUF2285 domain-containing protein n=2 Tax=Hyphomicrobiales TaxID=356 RepID=A0A927EFV0_9HYPH|nr:MULTISPECIES: DUF2285 domain-containing protein [Alphaproteobacteria]KIU50295.1 hypothetical protein QU41_08245 [Bradyrhizobium elkanii]MAH71769.1 DUF2285 domain-containing protein [Afipia sp.]MBK5654232.1 DUF2285 domain-containing protein [Rhizobium sp.]MBL6940499.1 DUF2285 domain-containing protein [Alphaproteobacteria bacterium]MBR1089071.1 DUF2285 domain-containing protein [Bradyrhizobium manausense]MBX9648899.1 DUF2285 domain-containing protein [Xanthobacteraceae bacterium]MCK9907532
MQAPPEAQVIWLPQEDTSAIVLGPPPDIPSASADPQPTIDAAVSVDVGSETHLVLDLGNGQRVALVHPSETRPAKSLGAFIPLGLEGFDRLQSVARLLSALHGRAIPPDTRLTRQQRARLCRMLQAFDGHRAGATQQEIAQVIFRIGALGRDDWQASSARHATKALLRDARAMMVGGYRTLLRHRRQL